MALASCGSIQGLDQGNLAPGSQSTGSTAGRIPLLLKRGDGSMYGQAYARARVFQPPSSSVAVVDRGHWKGVCAKRMGPCKGARSTPATRTRVERWSPPGCDSNGRVSGWGARRWQADKCSFAHRQVGGRPGKKNEKGWWQKCSGHIERCTAVGLRISGYGAAGICSILRKYTKVLVSTRRARFTKAALRQTNIREKKGPSLGTNQVKVPRQRRPYALKFEDRSQEEIERQERCARGDAWKLAKNICKLKETEKATFYSPSDEWVLPAASTTKPEQTCIWSAGKTLTLPIWNQNCL